MARPFSELRNKVTPERRKRNEEATQEMLKEVQLYELRLYELRRAMSLSQEQIAETLKIKQSSVSKIERNTDILISTLRRYLRAMGAELVIRAEFPDGEVEISQFQDLEPFEIPPPASLPACG